ncbi:transcriptional regulator [Helicobacter valdiviensis]|uniref:Transcriptional regulator n=1 Tax=Helicobacter valdiviensis TaxID=1458358 RepID=A0A2W6MXG7_9HELI|nr:helix-turn-helix transcriptional regulator [Helicobacter valdiviensis]PZT49067.1 transcriptional regulator [Helicobacter valdiviensis]
MHQKEIDKFHQKLSSKIRKLREEKGISQLDLALEIGIKSVAFYLNCENNRYKKHFNLEHIYKISKALNISLYSLFKDL